MPHWLVVSVVLSIVLTIVVNVVVRLFPGAGRRAAEGFGRLASDADRKEPEGGGSRVQLIVPWKAMLVGSIVLTIVLNVLLLLVR